MLPESPRWLLQKARQTSNLKTYEAAFKALRRLRNSKLHAARDLITINYLLHNEEKVQKQRTKEFSMLYGNQKKRLTASLIRMFGSMKVALLNWTNILKREVHSRFYCSSAS